MLEKAWIFLGSSQNYIIWYLWTLHFIKCRHSSYFATCFRIKFRKAKNNSNFGQDFRKICCCVLDNQIGNVSYCLWTRQLLKPPPHPSLGMRYLNIPYFPLMSVATEEQISTKAKIDNFSPPPPFPPEPRFTFRN